MDRAISIIIPSYNGAARLPNILGALHPQLDPGDEVLVVDDASSDATAATAQNLGAGVITLEDNSGVGAARNAGCFQAANELLVVFDDDVVPLPGFLDHVRNIFADPQIQCCQGPHALDPVEKDADIWQKADSIHWRHMMEDCLVENGTSATLYSGAFCVRKSFFSKIGGFNPTFSGAGGEEFELTSRITRYSPIYFRKELETYHSFKSLWHRMRTLFNRSKVYNTALKEADGLFATMVRNEKIKVVVVYMTLGLLGASILFPDFLTYGLVSGLTYLLLEHRLLHNTRKWKGLHWLPVVAAMRFLHNVSIGAGGGIGIGIAVWDKFKFLFNDVPGYMIFWVTQNCNARCPHCFNWQENTKKNHDLKLDEIVKLAKNYGHLKYMTIAGGEPSLRNDLPEIVAAFVQYSGLQMCTVITNGYRWKQMLQQVERICHMYPQLGLNVAVSIDAIGADHDKHRGLDGCYDGSIALVEGVQELRKKFPNVMAAANGVYSSANADTILATGRHIITRYNIPFSMALVRGEVKEPGMKEVDIDHFRQVSNELLQLQDSVIPKTTFDAPFRFALDEMALDGVYHIFTTGEPYTRCQAGRQGVVLESNGKLRLCEELPDAFGNVRDNDYDIPKMLASPQARKLIDWVWESKCRCIWTCYLSASIPFDKKHWPRFAYLSLKNWMFSSSAGKN